MDSVPLKPRWPPVRVGDRSRRSYEKIGDCQQSTLARYCLREVSIIWGIKENDWRTAGSYSKCPFWRDDFLTHAVHCIFVVFYFESKNRGLARKLTSSKALNNLSLTLMHSPTLPIPFIRSIFTSSTRSSGSARTMMAWAGKWFKPSHQYLLTLRLGFYRDYNSFCTTVEPPYNEHLNNQPSP